MNPILVLLGIGVVLYLYGQTAADGQTAAAAPTTIDQGGVAIPSDVVVSPSSEAPIEDYPVVGTGAPPPVATGDTWYDFEQMTEWKMENPEWIYHYPELAD
jgi:hypothetical protein